MIVNITIPTPVLVSPEYFRVRYREVGTVPWTTAANQTNAPFTLNLTVGDWEIEFSLVKADATICPAVMKYLTVVDPVADDYCLSAVPVITATGPYYNLEIPFTPPTTQSPCGYEFQYGPVGGPYISHVYSPLPASPVVYPISNQNYELIIWAILCSGLRIPCYDDTVTVPPVPSCLPSVLEPVVFTGGGGNTYLKFEFTQSTPATNPFWITWAQTNVPGAGAPDPGGTMSFPVAALQTEIYVLISPNWNGTVVNGVQIITYSGSFSDTCESKTWSVTLELT